MVTPEHELSKRAVDIADARLDRVSGLDGDVESRVRSRINTLQTDEFGEE